MGNQTQIKECHIIHKKDMLKHKRASRGKNCSCKKMEMLLPWPKVIKLFTSIIYGFSK
jgi:hypothetical protein